MKITLYHITKLVFSGIIIVGCSSVRKIAIDRDTTSILKSSEVFSQHFTGFSLFDLETNEYISDHNSTLLFTPASNTKLLTMYITLKTFSDSIPGLVYRKNDSSIHVMPIGDPTFLHDRFKNQPIVDLLQKQKEIAISWPEEKISPYGSGWAWDDYLYDYQSQRTWWPIYGNTVTIHKQDSTVRIVPPFFSDFVEVISKENPSEELVSRQFKYNLFQAYINEGNSAFTKKVPFDFSQETLLELLRDTLSSSINFTSDYLIPTDTLLSQSVDSVLQQMLKPSDNFIAEQLLILAAWKNGYQDIKPFIEHVRTIWLSDLNDLVWVDGSGLSRYNLIAPVDQVRLLKKSLDEFGWDRVTSLLPAGDEGTLEGLYLAEEPYLYAKTGTLSNNHNLTGFLITKSGKRLIFSIMNNHFIRPTDEIRKAVETFLQDIRNAY